MEIKKSEMTKFAKDCSYGLNSFLNGICMAEEIEKTNIAKEIHNGNDELLLEVSKRFAKYAKDQMCFDTDSGEVQDFKNLIDKMIECCDENDLF